MPRTRIDTLLHMMDVAYRADPFSALRRNIESVTPDEWNIVPAEWSAAEFGEHDPELSICQLVLHVAGAKHMYANRAFGDGTYAWGSIPLPSAFAMPDVLVWLEDGHQRLSSGLASLEDDADLAAERTAPWGVPMRRELFVTIMISHDLYHAGEINRQRALIRGAKGWTG